VFGLLIVWNLLASASPPDLRHPQPTLKPTPTDNRQPQELDAALSKAGLAAPGAYGGAAGAKALAAVWAAICGVWASKWGDRAWLSRKARGVPESDLVMSVLIQQVGRL
jgi:hypothetical protein